MIILEISRKLEQITRFKIDKDNNVSLETVKSTSKMNKMNPIEWTRSKKNKPYFL